jgi:colicin import membrane protein
MAGITAEMVAAAEVEVTEAERARTEAEAALMESPTSTVKATELTSALRRVAQARANAAELRQAHAAQVAAERAAASREELEKAASKDIAAAGKDLKAARGQLEEAAEVAQRALVDLMRQAEAYDALVERHADVLAGRGLDLDGESGGGRSFSGATVKARGQLFQSAGSGSALAHVAYRVAEARLPYPSTMVGLLQYNCGRLVPEDRADGLLGGLPVPERVEFPELPRLKSAL